MSSEIEITAVEQDGSDGIVVTFSDGTIGGYLVQELVKLRPRRNWTVPHETPIADNGDSSSMTLSSAVQRFNDAS